MPKWNSGDRAQVVTRPVTEEDRKKNQYFDHMAGLRGTIQSVYSDHHVALQVDPDSLSPITAEVHQTATKRLREKFASSVSEENRKVLTKEELEFNTNYVLLVRDEDLEKI